MKTIPLAQPETVITKELILECKKTNRIPTREIEGSYSNVDFRLAVIVDDFDAQYSFGTLTWIDDIVHLTEDTNKNSLKPILVSRTQVKRFKALLLLLVELDPALNEMSLKRFDKLTDRGFKMYKKLMKGARY